MRKRAVVVGSGAGGATVARELQGEFDVTVVEAGKDFRRVTLDRGADRTTAPEPPAPGSPTRAPRLPADPLPPDARTCSS